MRIVLFSLYGYEVYSHGVFLVLGLVIAGLLMYRLLKKEGLATKNFLSNYLLSVISGIIASRAVFYFMNLYLYDSLYQMLEIWQGGLVSFAGFIVGALVFVVLLKKQKSEIEPVINLTGIAFPLGIAIGRIGCALNGEVGIKTKSIFAYYGFTPVTAFEIFICSGIFIINFLIYLKFRDKLSKYFLFFTFVLMYSMSRIIIDSWRIDSKVFLNLNYSQITSLLIFVIVSFLHIKNRIYFSSLSEKGVDHENR
jgi:phosphatidylglycerol---prolipoprotein diacylglyceryl transferase